MKAAVVPAASSSWQVKDVPQPQAGPNQVLTAWAPHGIRSCSSSRRCSVSTFFVGLGNNVAQFGVAETAILRALIMIGFDLPRITSTVVLTRQSPSLIFIAVPLKQNQEPQ